MTDSTACKVHHAIDILGSKWVLPILYNLCTGTRGFNELERRIEGISPRILSLRLKELVEFGLVKKNILPTSPPQTEYSLTEKGATLKSVVTSLGEWAEA